MNAYVMMFSCKYNIGLKEIYKGKKMIAVSIFERIYLCISVNKSLK